MASRSAPDDGISAVGASDDITMTQRMLCATTGGILTSLLVTPLDVVRVRLQSQASPASPAKTTAALQSVKASPSPLNPSVRFTAISELGVTSCCRQVFWANNLTPACFAGPASGSMAALQVPQHTSPSSAAACAVEDSQRKLFTSTWDGISKIAKNEGIPSLWRGLTATLALSLPANVIYFSAYDIIRHSPRSPIKQYASDQYAPVLGGSIARVGAAFCISPIEMFRTRMQAAGGSQEGILKKTMGGMSDLVKAQGITVLWRGLTLTLWRDVPFSGFYWLSYENIRKRLTAFREASKARAGTNGRYTDPSESTLIDAFAAGAISGALSSIITMPFDVGKTRQQIRVYSKEAAGAAVLPEDKSMLRFLSHIYREEGLKGLFRGIIPRTMKVAPACAIMISSYEVGKQFARKANEKRTTI